MFLIISCDHKPWVSSLHPAGAFSFLKIAFLEISSMGIIKNPFFFPGGCRFLLASLDFPGLGRFREDLYVGVSVHKQYSLLDTLFNYMFYFGPPGTYLYLSPQPPLPIGQRSRPTVVGFLDLFIDIFLEVQNKTYS